MVVETWERKLGLREENKVSSGVALGTRGSEERIRLGTEEPGAGERVPERITGEFYHQEQLGCKNAEAVLWGEQ